MKNKAMHLLDIAYLILDYTKYLYFILLYSITSNKFPNPPKRLPHLVALIGTVKTMYGLHGRLIR
jgi:hypothetical protein